MVLRSLRLHNTVRLVECKLRGGRGVDSRGERGKETCDRRSQLGRGNQLSLRASPGLAGPWRGRDSPDRAGPPVVLLGWAPRDAHAHPNPRMKDFSRGWFTSVNQKVAGSNSTCRAKYSDYVSAVFWLTEHRRGYAGNGHYCMRRPSPAAQHRCRVAESARWHPF